MATRCRSSGAARGIVGTAVVVATANGGDGRVRWRRGERAEEGEWSRESLSGPGGVRGVVQKIGEARQAGRSWRDSPARWARNCFSSWQEEEDSAAPGGPGWLWPVGHYSGGLHGKVPLFFYISCILLFCNFVALLKILRYFQNSLNCSCSLYGINPT